MIPWQDPLFVAGNVLGDYYKGTPPAEFPEALKAAIRLHRAVDTFTDKHPAYKDIGHLLEELGRYRGVFADILVDHLLSQNLEIFPDKEDFGRYVTQIRAQFGVLRPFVPPGRLEHYHRISKPGWLESYRASAHLKTLVQGVCRRMSHGPHPETCWQVMMVARPMAEEKAWKLYLDTRIFVNELLFKFY